MSFRAAIIGTGRIGSRLERDPLRARPHTHAGWYAAHPDVQLVAGADLDPAAREAFATDWAGLGVRTYERFEELLDRERPDLVSICAYAPDRLAMARAAIAAGVRGLWLEKAVGCSMAEADALLRLAREARVPVVVNHPRSQDGRYRAVRRIVQAGELGRLESVHAIFSGNLVHTGTHAWEALDNWCGAWEEVRCWPEPVDAGPGRPPVDPGAAGRGPAPATGWAAEAASAAGTPGAASDLGGAAIVRFPGGTQAFVSAWRKDYFLFQFDLVFSRGRIRLGNEVARLFRTVPSRRYAGFTELADEGEPLEGPGGPPLLQVLVDRVRQGSPDASSLEAAVRALALGIAVVQAAGEPGSAVTPRRLDPGFYVASV